jgi:crotonobetainyl-CoA:carnitine CoA-transferase CaiB-like acyl-CoA transferase
MGDQTFVGDEPAEQDKASATDLVYETADGWITVAVQTNAQWVALCGALDRDEWLDDPRFRTPALRQQNVGDRLRLTQEALKTGSSADWLEKLTKAQVPCAPVLTRNQVMHAPQVEALGLVVETAHHKAGKIRQTRPAARFSRTPSEIRRGAPTLGEDTGAILAELGLSTSEVAVLREARVVS